jgi:hypothetical protein
MVYSAEDLRKAIRALVEAENRLARQYAIIARRKLRGRSAVLAGEQLAEFQHATLLLQDRVRMIMANLETPLER